MGAARVREWPAESVNVSGDSSRVLVNTRSLQESHSFSDIPLGDCPNKENNHL